MINLDFNNWILTEGLNHSCIVVDVQPAYAKYNKRICEDIIKFICKQNGPILMYINAELHGLTEDTIDTIKNYWNIIYNNLYYDYDYEEENYYDDNNLKKINWNNFKIIDKGYGYLRSWMDHGIEEKIIISTIRELYKQKISDTRELDLDICNNFIKDAVEEMRYDPLIVNWIDISILKNFSGSYIVGGGRNECLREVELMMNAFNIKYKRINNLVYG